jgi:hypothetical protein
MKPEVAEAFKRICDPTGFVQGRDETIIRQALEEGARLDALVNNPEMLDFMKGVQLEAAHQVEKWGEAHDRDKSAENWFWLVGYLAGKCLRAVICGDRTKALHHTISTAAACANWHRAIKADATGTGVGDDRDLIEIARLVGVDAQAAEARADHRQSLHAQHTYLGGSGHGSTVPLT